MRILYLHQYFRTPKMPGGTRSYEIARRLVQRGHEVHMVTSDQNPSSNQIRTSQEEGIRVTWIPAAYSNRMGYPSRVMAFLKYGVLAAEQGLEWRPDVVYATSTPLTIGIPAVMASRHWQVPMVFEVRDLWPEVPIAMGALRNPLAIHLARRLERLCYESSSHIVALSPGMKDGVVNSGWAHRSKISVIPNLTNPDFSLGTDQEAAEALTKLQLPSARQILLYAGTLGRVNDVSYLADLAAEVLPKRSQYLFLIVGDGVEREKVTRRAEELGVLNKNFYMRGRIAKSQMRGLLKSASISISTVADIPELFNNSANKFFDALAAGTPVLINHEGWQADLIRQESLGVVLPRRIEEAASILIEFLDDPERQVIARKKSAIISERFTADRAAEQVEQILLASILNNESNGSLSGLETGTVRQPV